MEKNNLKISYRLALLKSNAIKLRGSYQLPSYLVYLILKITKDTNVNLVKKLMHDSEMLLRVKGFYKKYPMLHEDTNNTLKEEYSNLLG